MPENLDVGEIAAALRTSIGLLLRRIRQVQSGGELTVPETSALAWLDREGPATAAALAKREQISPQSMGATLAALERRGLIERRPDPNDGRKAIISATHEGLRLLRLRRADRTERLARALSAEFEDSELKRLAAVAPLIERLARSL